MAGRAQLNTINAVCTVQTAQHKKRKVIKMKSFSYVMNKEVWNVMRSSLLDYLRIYPNKAKAAWRQKSNPLKR
jgi:hypothetical protein